MPRRKKNHSQPLASASSNFGGIPVVKEVYASIVCQPEHCHLSTEEMRWRYYLDCGRASLPESGPPSPPPPAAVDVESATSICSLCAARLTLSGRGHGGNDILTERVLSAGDAAQQVHEYNNVESNRATDRDNTPTPSALRRHDRRSHKEWSKSKVARRIRRLEKTVETLSHGLVLALTELNAGGVHAGPRGRPSSSAVHGGESDFVVDTVDGLSTAFAGMGAREDSSGIGVITSSLLRNAESSSLEENLDRTGPSQSFRNGDGGPIMSVSDPPGSTPGTSTSHATLIPPVPQPRLATPRCSDTDTGSDVLSLSRESKSPCRTQPDSVLDHAAMGNDKSLLACSIRSPISGLLRPILNFMMCSEVSQFLKQAETHPGLRSTQIFDLFWVLDNLFNVHGGIVIHCLRKSLTLMDSISGFLGSEAWSQDSGLVQKLDEAYRKDLFPCIHIDGTCNSIVSAAWKSYCHELAVIFTERFPTWTSACRYFRDLSECYEGYLNPVITTSYIEDLNAIWTEVHPALLEVTRWLEPFVDYGPDYNRATPLYDATIAVVCRARELFSREGAKEPDISQRADEVLQLLRKHRSEALPEMQAELAFVMSTVSRGFDETDRGDNTPAESGLPSAEEAALVQRAVEVTGWQVTEPGSVRQRDALALHEVRVMKKYRPRLLRVGTVASQIRLDVIRILAQTEGGSVPSGEKVVFWDGIV